MHLQQFHFDPSGEPISEDTLRAFEKEIGGRLDDSIRVFLLSVNGGVPSPALKSSHPKLPYSILVFYRLLDGYHGLRRMFHDCNSGPFTKGLGNYRLLPIAGDTGDRQICLNIVDQASSMFLYSDEDPESPIIEPLKLNFDQFVASLSQPEEPEIKMEVLANKSWEEIEEYLKQGGEIGSVNDELSLLCQSIRCEKPDLFERLMDRGVDITDAVEIAVLNNKLSMLKRLISAGGDAAEALDFAVGPQREEMRAYLRTVIRDTGKES